MFDACIRDLTFASWRHARLLLAIHLPLFFGISLISHPSVNRTDITLTMAGLEEITVAQ